MCLSACAGGINKGVSEVSIKRVYDKFHTYHNANPSVSLKNVDKIALLKTDDITGNPLLSNYIYTEIKKRLEFLGYEVVPYSTILKVARSNGLRPMELFHPPYIRKTIRTFGVSAFMISSLIDYQCDELTKEQLIKFKRDKDNGSSLCSFTIIMRVADLDIIGEKERILWAGTTAFRNILKEVNTLFRSKLDKLLKDIPPHGEKPPKHPL